MSPAPSLRQPSPAGPALETSPRRSRLGVTAAACVAVVLHFWALYRDHGPPRFRWFPQADKLEHLLGFGVPCFLVLLALQLHAAATGRVLRTRTVGFVVSLFVVHAGVSEVVQGAFTTTRSGDPYDAVADLLGTLLGVLAFLVMRQRLRPGPREGRDPREESRGRG